jgi:hypothetical protein
MRGIDTGRLFLLDGQTWLMYLVQRLRKPGSAPDVAQASLFLRRSILEFFVEAEALKSEKLADEPYSALITELFIAVGDSTAGPLQSA